MLSLVGCASTSQDKMVATSPAQGAAITTGGYGGNEVAQAAPTERRGLGTTWGEQVNSGIEFQPFSRASPAPWAEMQIHYNDAQGVMEHAAYLHEQIAPLHAWLGDGALGVSLVDDGGQVLGGVAAADRTLVVGQDGERYRIVVHNATAARFEVVASVDGLDVIDGKPADPNRRGYLVNPHDDLVIDGFRTSNDTVAAFRFGAVADSYAAQTSGDRNVGVIGLAVFAERGAQWAPVPRVYDQTESQIRDTADPFPSRGYASPPR
ncbi:MAG TPA: hypothetical protein VGM88_25130 [Kofleriaceae bacterium]